MFDYIERLRAKSDSEKKRFAFLVALSIAGIIFVVWLSIIFPSWKREQAEERAEVVVEPTPGGAIGTTFKEGFSSIGKSFSELKEYFSNFGGGTHYDASSTPEGN